MPRFREIDTATNEFNLKKIASNTGSANASRMSNDEPDQINMNVEKVNDYDIESKLTPNDIGSAMKM